ncbi:ribulose-5-phosphate 4-epimerase/fuculose-1-phosphate aldolase [Streptomyces pseudovenezuelae]|uniref:L-ribulose-5-phosphate 4-epimerase n=1 Tax=Streptomyces pseudovenezuelae TaxID=67350 RepID=A0ABT6LCI3_9ACTN|nr:ribulose-5-phosphate 4-epimerase/fuculose-1-phosphate aldolase [Streptomyces pseudovenezuelae]
MLDAIAEVRAELHALHRSLVDHGLVAWTSGNVSARVAPDLMLIKPSGVPYDELRPEDLVLYDLSGVAVTGTLRPSSDAASHGYVYRTLPEVHGVVHTHSTYATAWAARGEPVPCVLTAMADEFGGEIPVGPLAPIGDDAVGDSPRAAVKAAVMCEDVARTVHLSRQLGESAAAWHRRWTPSTTATGTTTARRAPDKATYAPRRAQTKFSSIARSRFNCSGACASLICEVTEKVRDRRPSGVAAINCV